MEELKRVFEKFYTPDKLLNREDDSDSDSEEDDEYKMKVQAKKATKDNDDDDDMNDGKFNKFDLM